jgi:hypothetical protein
MYWKRNNERSNCFARLFTLGATLFAAFVFLGPISAQDRTAQLQEHFDKDDHAGSKVKLLEHLTDVQFEETRKASAAGDFNRVGFIFEKYRDNLRACFNLLRTQEPDPDRHGNNYRRVELQARRGIREVEDTLTIMPAELRPPLELVHKDVQNIDDELIRLLFPPLNSNSNSASLAKPAPPVSKGGP